MTSREPAPDRIGLRGGVTGIVFVLIVAVGAGVGMLADPAPGPVGQTAPDVHFVDFEGNRLQLADIVAEGRPVLVNLWASWCEPCLREFGALSDFAVARPDIIVVGIAVEDRLENARTFVEATRPSFLVGFDVDGTLRRSLPYHGLPTTYLISSDGIVIAEIMAELTPARLETLEFG